MPKYTSESDDSERECEEVEKKHKKSKKHKEQKKRKRDSSEERKRSKKHKKKHKEEHRDSSPSPTRYDPQQKIKTEPESDAEKTERDRRKQEQDRHKHDRRRIEDRPRKTEAMRADLSKVKKEPPEKGKKEPPEKTKPNLELSGKLAEDTNTYNGVVIQYNEPSEARKPKRRWRLYIFKGDSMLPVLYVHRQSAYLLGRDRRVADIPIDHPSCSKQHAVFQYRLVPYTRNNGTVGKRVRPYIIDLDSANGTYLNNKKIDGRRYVELMEKDVLKFGFSSREYVLLHEESKESSEDED